MKRMLVLLAVLVSFVGAKAFDFDGISLNQNRLKIAQEISKRGYSYDKDRDCLKGVCQGTEIYLRMDYTHVKEAGMLGQLIVEIPVDNAKEGYKHMSTLLNVVYHQISKDEATITYLVDEDGTTVTISQKGSSIFLTYNTPYYKNAK